MEDLDEDFSFVGLSTDRTLLLVCPPQQFGSLVSASFGAESFLVEDLTFLGFLNVISACSIAEGTFK